MSNFISSLPDAEGGCLVYQLADEGGSRRSPPGTLSSPTLQFSEQRDLVFASLESSVDKMCSPVFFS